MRALLVREPGAIELAEVADPVPGAEEVLVRPTLVGICGTDLDIVDGRVDPLFIRYPMVLGHEWTGVVAEPGRGGLAAGTRVVVEGIVPCGRCTACAAGATNRCDTYDELGFTRYGAAAELVRAPAHLVHPLAPQVSEESAVLTEPASVVFTGLSRVSPVPGWRVLVIGDGTIGLLAARLAHLWSPSEVTLLGRRPEQAGLAAGAGVGQFTVDTEAVPAGHFDLVVEAAGSAAAVRTAFAAVRRGGVLLLLGYLGGPPGAELPVDDVVNGDLTIAGSFGYTRTAWRRVVDLLNAGSVDLGFLVTHRFPLEAYAAAFAALREGSGPRAKVALTPAG